MSFVHEANKWFPEIARQYNFIYDSTNDWSKLNTGFLKQYKIVIFLDTRPEDPRLRLAFEAYMKEGGGWIGFHFSGIALTPSGYPQN
ncbi:ThuA domain-containing protein [Parafilimonas sp.]|uniref:ThuA domain-containing protein n=1 Tax=Parafilimonas sp. TaxID=1969739 RepID=UPI0039E36BB6